MAIYTRTGDQGETGLLGGARIRKDDLQVDCYGTLDEANAALGMACSLIENEGLKRIVRFVQKQLFILGAELASDEKGRAWLKERIEEEHVDALEQMIDRFEGGLGTLKEFLLPGETTASAALHLARTIVRRAERMMVALSKRTEIRKELIQYVNRLSDALFTLARAEAAVSQEMPKGAVPAKQEVKLSLSLACKLAAIAEEQAAKLGIPIVFSAVDPGGHPILLHRMEGSLLCSLDVAVNKAYTAVALKTATHELSPSVQPGAELYGLSAAINQPIVMFGGGYPLFVDGTLIGAIGVSGGSLEQDMLIADEVMKGFESGGDLKCLHR